MNQIPLPSTRADGTLLSGPAEQRREIKQRVMAPNGLLGEVLSSFGCEAKAALGQARLSAGFSVPCVGPGQLEDSRVPGLDPVPSLE